ncbi:MAG: DMT family transporter [Blastochloris sp.]|nr:DMT family transporter [Blastochloris sp.]
MVDAQVSMSRAYLFLPLASAVLYAFSAIAIKRSIDLGMGPWRMTFLSNLFMLAIFGSTWFWHEGSAWPETWWPPVLSGFLFFVGQIFTFLSLTRGDVSIATPVLGTKVILVAVFLWVLLGERVAASVWVAAVLATLGIALLQWGSPVQHRDRTGRTVLLAFCSAAAFALGDIVVQRWCPVLGFGWFMPISSSVTMLLSFFLIPYFNGPLWKWPEGSVAFIWLGLGLLALQALGMAVSIGIYGDAAGTNIVYASRGLWTVLLIWWVGHWFANQEREQGAGTMVTRLLGAVFIMSAVILIFA